MPAETWTTLRVLEWTTERFTKAGMESPRLDAQILLAHTLRCERVQLYTNFDRPLDQEELGAYRALIKERLAGRPVAYLIGEQEFWSLPFAVTGEVLIPRRDTETLIEVVLDEVKAEKQTPGKQAPEPETEGDAAADAAAEPGSDTEPQPDTEAETARPSPLRIADVATGSGAIAIALAHELADATVVATDISPRAAAIAEQNARMNQVADRVEVRVGDLFAPLAGETFDIIVSNPPYIPTADLAGLAAEVRYEPRLALDGGADGLALLRSIISQAPAYLAPGGLLAVEHGYDQAEEVAALFANTSLFLPACLRRDLGKNPRVTYARMRGSEGGEGSEPRAKAEAGKTGKAQ